MLYMFSNWGVPPLLKCWTENRERERKIEEMEHFDAYLASVSNEDEVLNERRKLKSKKIKQKELLGYILNCCGTVEQ